MTAAARDQVLRFRVFRFILAFHESVERWPSDSETAQALGITVGSASHHLQCLHHAKGLPAPTNKPGRLPGRRKRDRTDDVVPVDVALRRPWEFADMVPA